MKNFRTIALCVSVTLCSLCVTAQNQFIPINEPNLNKPEMFRNLPDNIPVSMASITSLFGTSVGADVSVDLSSASSFQIEGRVVSSVSKYNNSIVSVVVRSTNYLGAQLSVTRITDDSGSISYTGRIISMQHADLYELRNISGQFYMVKKKFYDLINE